MDRILKKKDMKKIFAPLLIAALISLAGQAQTQTLTIQVTNVKDAEGHVRIAIYNSDKDFMKKWFMVKSAKAAKGTVEVVIDNLPAGTYGISVMHDANSNEKMDSNMIGMPKEGFGFSNNAKGTFGPPSYEKTKIDFSTSKQISIAMTYL
ncbi:MAG: DUF2141 domain-containing protein [Cyclobacteriaceae bacterium]|jgi:uncharacterized protein (DUF2141 family)|nr:DUF2141 domain-containing protein [Flammeovirgaceae bacterium]